MAGPASPSQAARELLLGQPHPIRDRKPRVAHKADRRHGSRGVPQFRHHCGITQQAPSLQINLTVFHKSQDVEPDAAGAVEAAIAVAMEGEYKLLGFDPFH